MSWTTHYLVDWDPTIVACNAEENGPVNWAYGWESVTCDACKATRLDTVSRTLT